MVKNAKILYVTEGNSSTPKVQIRLEDSEKAQHYVNVDIPIPDDGIKTIDVVDFMKSCIKSTCNKNDIDFDTLIDQNGDILIKRDSDRFIKVSFVAETGENVICK